MNTQLSAREVLGLITWLVKSDTITITATFFVLPKRYAAEMGHAASNTLLRKTASMKKIKFV